MVPTAMRCFHCTLNNILHLQISGRKLFMVETSSRLVNVPRRETINSQSIPFPFPKAFYAYLQHVRNAIYYYYYYICVCWYMMLRHYIFQHFTTYYSHFKIRLYYLFLIVPYTYTFEKCFAYLLRESRKFSRLLVWFTSLIFM